MQKGHIDDRVRIKQRGAHFGHYGTIKDIGKRSRHSRVRSFLTRYVIIYKTVCDCNGKTYRLGASNFDYVGEAKVINCPLCGRATVDLMAHYKLTCRGINVNQYRRQVKYGEA